MGGRGKNPTSVPGEATRIVSRTGDEEALGKSDTILGEKQRQKNIKGKDEKKEGAQDDSGAPET